MKNLIAIVLFLTSCSVYVPIVDHSHCKSVDVVVKKSGREIRYDNVQVLSEQETHIVFMHTGRSILHNGEYLIICNTLNNQ